jgi:hypothetical protein
MIFTKKIAVHSLLLFLVLISLHSITAAQTKPELLAGDNLKKVVPTSFYFAGQSAATQERNTAAAKIGADRYVIVGLVDTSGYSTEISGKYEGFLITDSPINVGGKKLETGAYGFGFSADNKLHIFDLSSKEIASVNTVNDKEMKRPRPLAMSVAADGVRFYKGKNYVLVAAQ